LAFSSGHWFPISIFSRNLESLFLQNGSIKTLMQKITISHCIGIIWLRQGRYYTEKYKFHFTFLNFEANVSEIVDRNIVFGNWQIKLKTKYFYKGTSIHCLNVYLYKYIYIIYLQTFIKKRISIEFVFFALKNGNSTVNIVQGTAQMQIKNYHFQVINMVSSHFHKI